MCAHTDVDRHTNTHRSAQIQTDRQIYTYAHTDKHTHIHTYINID